MVGNYNRQLDRMLDVMTDDIGIVQHCDFDKPIKKTNNPYPYSIDDVARALVVLSRISRIDGFYSKIKEREKMAEKINHCVGVYLNFINRNKKPNGFFHNYQDLNGNPVKQSINEEDSFARVLSAWTEFLKGNFPKDLKEQTRYDFIDELPISLKLLSPISQAISLMSLARYLETEKDKSVVAASKIITFELADRLSRQYKEHHEEGWVWFSDKMTYYSAKLPHSMLLSSQITERQSDKDIGKKTLDFLIKLTFEGFTFSPIGNRGWYTKQDFFKGKSPPKYDQQTVEAYCMVEACSDAEKILLIPGYEIYKKNAFEWFNGRNINKTSLLSKEGGVYDALVPKTNENPDGVNKNQGAESLLSYLMAASV
ncbi:MAG: hypothetical protein QXI33_00985 [Candidatus Pacearchaeota archaeon]